MKQEFKAHPLMILSLIKPFLFVLILPVLKGAVQYLIYRRITGVFTLEAAALIVMLLAAFLRFRSFSIVCGKNGVKIREGVFLKKTSYIAVSKLSSVQTVQNPLDAVFGAVTYCVNTEAGKKGKTDFKFKLSLKNSKKVSELLYGKSDYTAVRFSFVKVAVMAATTSSAVTGMIIGVPIINKAGKLLGLALDSILLNEINNVSGQVKSYFPPIVSAITLIFLLSYAVSFVYSFLKYINFKLFLEKDKLEVRSGFFVRSRTSFKKSSVNDVIIDQTPLMRLFKRYAMKVSVGGYGNSKSETAAVLLYYSYLCIFDFRFGKLRIGDNIYAQGIKGFNTYEFYCPKENVGEIKIIRTLPARKYGTCTVTVSVRSESADSVTVRHLDYGSVKQNIFEVYNIKV